MCSCIFKWQLSQRVPPQLWHTSKDDEVMESDVCVSISEHCSLFTCINKLIIFHNLGSLGVMVGFSLFFLLHTTLLWYFAILMCSGVNVNIQNNSVWCQHMRRKTSRLTVYTSPSYVFFGDKWKWRALCFCYACFKLVVASLFLMTKNKNRLQQYSSSTFILSPILLFQHTLYLYSLQCKC